MRAKPSLLSFDDARTLFHEFGHALHGMLSDVTYPLLSGTNVARDFVEFPSQLYEHWLERPEILRRFAVPSSNRRADARGAGRAACWSRGSSIRASRRSNSPPPRSSTSTCIFSPRQGRSTSSPLKTANLQGSACPPPSRCATAPRISSIFSPVSGYSAGYYSYLWSETLDADGFEAFEESGDIFDPALARRLHDYVYAAGNLREPDAAYAAFRGRAPKPEPLLRKRGLVEADPREAAARS